MQFALGTVTLLALLMTIAMGIVTWRLVREERRRSAARLEALAAELRARGITPRPVDASTEEPAAAADLFEPSLDSTGGGWRQLTGVGVAGAALVVLVSVAVFAMSGGRDDGLDGTQSVASEAERIPVELLTLAHERADGMLAISGTVRNPEHGHDAPQLSVLAMAFDTDGALVASGRTQLEAAALPAGAESSFSISLPAEHASRYRISFLSDDITVPHLDRRDPTRTRESES